MKKIGLIIFGIIIIAAAGRAYWAYQKAIVPGAQSLSPAVVPSESQTNNTQDTLNSNQPVSKSSSAVSQIDCGSDFNCFISAAKQCTKAIMTNTTLSTALVPVLQAKVVWTYQIAGVSAGNTCVSSKHVSDATLTYIGNDPTEKNTILNSSTFAKMLASVKANIGKTSVCTTTDNRLVEMATQLSLGQPGETASDKCTVMDINGNPWVPKSVDLTQ